MTHTKHEWVDGELITAEKLNNSQDFLINSVNESLLYLNILDYGADREGSLDSTFAFKNAISDLANKFHATIFIPKGNYVISEEIFINDFDIVGENRENTNIIIKGAVGFAIGNGQLDNVTIDLTQCIDNVKAITIGSNNSSVFQGGNDGKLNRIYIKATFTKPKTTGIYVYPHSDSQENVAGAWGNNIHDIVMRSIGTGINLTAGSYGFVNGNAFENILIKGFYENGILIDSDSPNSYTNQRNYFKHIQVQANGDYALKDAVAYNIKNGQNNVFEDVTEWNDTGGVDDIVSLNLGTSQGSPTIYDIVNNQFINSKFEHKITGDKKLLYLNTIKANVINFSAGNYLTGTSKHFDLLDTSKIKNLLDHEIIYSEIVDSGNNGLTISGKSGTTIGQNGSEIVLSGNSSLALNLNANQVGRVFSSKFLTISISFYSDDTSTLNILNSLTIKNPSGTTKTVSATKIFGTNTVTGYDYHLLYDLSSIDPSILSVNSTILETVQFTESTSTVNVSKVKMTNYPNIAMSKYEDVFQNNHLLKLGNSMLRINGSNIQKTTDNGTTWTNI